MLTNLADLFPTKLKIYYLLELKTGKRAGGKKKRKEHLAVCNTNLITKNLKSNIKKKKNKH